MDFFSHKKSFKKWFKRTVPIIWSPSTVIESVLWSRGSVEINVDGHVQLIQPPKHSLPITVWYPRKQSDCIYIHFLCLIKMVHFTISKGKFVTFNFISPYIIPTLYHTYLIFFNIFSVFFLILYLWCKLVISIPLKKGP